MTHGFKNIFGEERMATPLFQTGGVVSAVAADWFFGTAEVQVPAGVCILVYPEWVPKG